MDILQIIKKEKKYQNILNDIINKDLKNIYIGNCCVNISKILAALSYIETNRFVIYTCSDTFEASKAFEMFVDLLGTDSVSVFPVEEFISTDLVASIKSFLEVLG